MSAFEQFTEANELLAHIPPTDANAAVGRHDTDWLRLSYYHRAVIIIDVGEAAAGATLDVAIYQAKSADGVGEKALDAKAPDQIVEADEGGIVVIEMQSEELDTEDDFAYIQVRVTVGTDTYHSSVQVWGTTPRYQPTDVSVFTQVVE